MLRLFSRDFRLFLVAAALMGLANVVVKPILRLFSLPLILLTLGLFLLVVNALVLWIVVGLSGALELGLSSEGFFWETFLAFLVMEEEEQGGGACAAAAGRLQPLLSDYLGPYDEVTLQEITEKTVVGVCLLSETLRTPQKYAVAPNAYSLAQALFSPAAWYRAVFAGKAPVGFIMLSDRPDEPEYFLWRFMIAPHFQGRGYGRAAIDRLVDYVRTRPGAQELLVSCILGDGSPLAFYERVGFVSTGKMEGDELVLKMAL